MDDIALKRNPATGKFTFDWDTPDGDVKWSPYAEYPVLTTLASHKGRYFWDATGQQGTLLYTVIKDGLATGSQLAGYTQDGLDQCRADGIIQSGSATAERVRPGVWIIRPRWKVGGRQSPALDLRLS